MSRARTGVSGVAVSEILQFLESRAPSGTAESWDNVGLIAGDPTWKTRNVVVSIDLTAAALETAIRKKARLIINHHPCIFPGGSKARGLTRVVSPDLVFEAIRNGIAVVACHTNFDQCSLEVVEAVAHGLGAIPMGRLVDDPSRTLTKLVVFVPVTHVEKVRTALTAAGAGHIGDYDFSTFGTEGEGTFRGGSKTRPFVGKPGKVERVKEVRLETILPKGLKKHVLKAMLAAHPYEEVAYDLYAVEQGPSTKGLVRGLGYGFWGEFPTPKPFPDLSRRVKNLFGIDGFLLTHPFAGRIPPVKRVAFVAGKGASFVESAQSLGCDLLITGESGYHPALGAAPKMMVMELGHRESELFFLRIMKEWLASLRTQAILIERNLPVQKILV